MYTQESAEEKMKEDDKQNEDAELNQDVELFDSLSNEKKIL